MKASPNLKRNNTHLKGAFFSDLDRDDFAHLVLNGVVNGLYTMLDETELPNHIGAQLSLYINSLELTLDALENCNIVSKDILQEKGIIKDFNNVINS